METWIILLAVAVWWTITVVALTNVLDEGMKSQGPKTIFLLLTGCFFWPVMAIFVFPLMIYKSLGYTTRQIRQDLHSQGLYREFRQWHDAKTKGTILTKE